MRTIYSFIERNTSRPQKRRCFATIEETEKVVLGCFERCNWAFELAQKRWELLGLKAEETRFDIIGYNSIVDGPNLPKPCPKTLTDLRARIAIRTDDQAVAQEMLEESTAGLSVHAAGSGLMTISVKPVVAVISILIPASVPHVSVIYKEVQP